MCLEGERACPPEDVGGVSSYAEFLNTIKDRDHRERGETLEWAEGWFDPDDFDAATATKSMFLPKTPRAAAPYRKLNTSGKITTTTHVHTAYTGRYRVCHRSRRVNPTRRSRNLA